MTDKERSVTIDWDTEVEDAIERYLTQLVLSAQEWEHHAVICGCHTCRRKAEAKEEDKNDAIYRFYADWQE